MQALDTAKGNLHENAPILGLPIGGKPNSDASLGRIGARGERPWDTRPNGPERRRKGVAAAARAYPLYLGQLLAPVALITLLLTSVIWLGATAAPAGPGGSIAGQSAPTFLYLTSLLIPSLLVNHPWPIAFFFAPCSPCRGSMATAELW